MNNINYLLGELKETLLFKRIDYVSDDNNVYLFYYAKIDDSIYVYNKTKGTEVKYSYSDNEEVLTMLIDLVGEDKKRYRNLADTNVV